MASLEKIEETIPVKPSADGRTAELGRRLAEFRRRENEWSWEGSFSDYFELVQRDPRLARLSHARVYDMIIAFGITEGDNGTPHYNFFEAELYGLEKSIAEVAEYFDSASRRLDVRKRILLLMGPPGGGKSTIVRIIKEGLERYTREPEGAVYAIKGCPMTEDPLHLIPQELRPEVEEKCGIYIEGELCPHCRQMVKDEYRGEVQNVPVKRIVLSEKDRVGIGTFSPSDPKSQDIAELVGGIDLSRVGEIGTESDPRAYRFDGELNVANRGLMEFIEMLKTDKKFLHVLLSLSQEQNIKTGRFSMIYADEVVISHTNEAEYNAFVANRKAEALQDRIIVVRVPYNLKVSDEVKIYEKLLRESALENTHIAPNTLEVASTFAVLSRLRASRWAGMTLMKKLKIYDGQEIDGYRGQHVKDLKEEAGPREGMEGISPRYIINRLSSAVVRHASGDGLKEDVPCVSPIAVLRALREGFEQSASIDPKEKERLLTLLAETRREYDEIAKREVQRAFVYSFEESAQTLLDNYLDNAEAYCNKTKIHDPITDKEVEPDEKLMRSIEEAIGVTENVKKDFREQMLIGVATLARKGQNFRYDSNPKLKDAIEGKLFADLRDAVKVTTSVKTPNLDQQKRITEVTNRLVKDHGYCPSCAGELLKYVGMLLNR